MSYYEINKEKIRTYQKLYYQKNKEKIRELNSEKVSTYLEDRDRRLQYQKEYNKNNKLHYNTYQRNYYHVRKAKPDFKEQSKMYRTKYYNKIKVLKDEARCIKRTKKLMTKLFRELLKKVPLYECETPDPEPVSEAEPIIIPFAGVRIDKRGYFVLDW